jgi:hypothetical protein
MKYLKTSFIGGEISPKMQNRFDFQGYNNSALWVENFKLTKEGNLNYRNGTYLMDKLNYAVNIKDKNLCQLFQWRLNQDRIFLLVFYCMSNRNYTLEVWENFKLLARPTLNASVAFMYLKDTDNPLFQIAYHGNTCYISCGVCNTFILTVDYNNKFVIDGIQYVQPPWSDENLTDIEFTCSITAVGYGTLTCNVDFFKNIDNDKCIKFRNPATNATGWLRINTVANSKQANVQVVSTLPISSTTYWSLSVVPKTISFYQGRMFYGAGNRIAASRTQDNNGLPRFNDFTLGTDPTNAINIVNYSIETDIIWFSETSRTLLAGTSTGIFKVL